MKTAVRTLIFDLDDTLVKEESSASAAFIEAGALARERYGLDPAALHETLRGACREIWYAFPSHPYCRRVGISSWEGMWAEFTGPGQDLRALRNWAPSYRRESWGLALKRHGIDDPRLAADLAELFPALRRSRHEIYPDAAEVLPELFGNYALGLLTNGASDLQRRKIEGAGIGKYFDEVLVSGDVGFGKPDPRLFAMLLDRLHASADAAVMVGNSLETDVQGAQKAGVKAVWLNRSGAERAGGIAPEYEISGLADLRAVLAEFPG